MQASQARIRRCQAGYGGPGYPWEESMRGLVARDALGAFSFGHQEQRTPRLLFSQTLPLHAPEYLVKNFQFVTDIHIT
jgi:hypothetical protein